MTKNLINYVKESSQKNKEFLLYGEIPFVVIDDFIANIDVKEVLGRIERTIPRRFVKAVEIMYVGYFDFLEARELTSMYIDNSIYLSPNQIDEQDVYADIVHEIAHALEHRYYQNIYNDGEIEKEFVKKKKKILDLLSRQGYSELFNDFNIEDTDYSIEFDNLLFKDIGYQNLNMIGLGLFISPYAITCLREYFANAFEHYYSSDRKYACQISPAACEKIRELENNLEAF